MTYFRSILGGAALLSLALLFVPERESLRRATLTVFSLLLLLLLLPAEGLPDLPSLFPKEEGEKVTLGEAYIETVRGAVSDGVRTDLCTRFSLSPADVRIESDLALTAEALTGTYLRLYLGKENGGADAAAILRYIQNAYGLRGEVHFTWN
jgi:hypothetical protein